jgi:trans-aconitate methyltransferase
VLDLGGGPAPQTLALASALPEARLVAVDVLPSMVEEANRVLGTGGATSARSSSISVNSSDLLGSYSVLVTLERAAPWPATLVTSGDLPSTG